MKLPIVCCVVAYSFLFAVFVRAAPDEIQFDWKPNLYHGLDEYLRWVDKEKPKIKTLKPFGTIGKLGIGIIPFGYKVFGPETIVGKDPPYAYIPNGMEQLEMDSEDEGF